MWQSTHGLAAVELVPVNPLSAPRGVRLVDELSGKPATLEWIVGSGTRFYYASQTSFQTDWDGVLCALAPLYAELAAVHDTVGTQAERALQAVRVHAIQQQMVAICELAAQHHLVRKRFELAVPAALRGVRLLTALHGESSPRLLPAYLQLAEGARARGGGIEGGGSRAPPSPPLPPPSSSSSSPPYQPTWASGSIPRQRSSCPSAAGSSCSSPHTTRRRTGERACERAPPLPCALVPPLLA